MGLKNIAIIGGGISGLAALHYLKKRLGDGAGLTLYERNDRPGGNIQSIAQDGFLFETGPNGFLSDSPETLALVEELGLSQELVCADPAAARRYIQFKGQLRAVPGNPARFIQTPLLTFQGKCRLIQGFFNSKVSKDQSIHGYVSKRFGIQAAENLFDPFVSGIFAGDITRLHMASCFTKKFPGRPKLMSFKKGMGAIISRLQERYQTSIQTGIEIARLKEFYGKPERRSRLSFQVTEEKVVNHLIGKAKVTEVTKDKLPT